MPHKPKPNIMSGITQASGILDNTSANNALNSLGNKMKGKSSAWVYGRTYDNNPEYPHASIDFSSDRINTLHGTNSQHVSKYDATKMNKSFSWFLATTRRRPPKRIQSI